MTPPPPKADPLSGRVGHLSVTQQHALDKIRQQLKDEGAFIPERHDDQMLLRFLRARKFDLTAAHLMLVEQEQWRKEFGVDRLVNHFDFPEKAEVDKYYPQFYHKTDKDGRPVYIERLGKLDIKALYAVTTQERLLERLVWEYEKFLHDRLPACTLVVGHPVETSCTILDLQGVSLSAFYKVKDYISKASAIGQNRYPESMGKFYIINAPWGFATIWNFIKPWLDEVTVAKIAILSSDFKKVLMQQIPAENLPADFGGSCKCAGGCSLSDQGPWTDPAIMEQVVLEKAIRKKALDEEAAAAPPAAEPSDTISMAEGSAPISHPEGEHVALV